jgi:hypothetical protein
MADLFNGVNIFPSVTFAHLYFCIAVFFWFYLLIILKGMPYLFKDMLPT